MTSRGTDRFWKLYAGLPADIKVSARKAFGRFRENQAHPSLHMERLRSDPRAWSVRVTLNHRAVPCGAAMIGHGSGSATTVTLIVSSPHEAALDLVADQ